MNYADREGTFRGQITDYGLRESQNTDSKSVGVELQVKLQEMWWDGAWTPWAEFDQDAFGTIWVVKKDGTLNKLGFESLMKHANWDGDLVAIDSKTWQPTPVQVVLKAEEYEGKTRYKIAFVNGYDDTPGGGGVQSIGPEKAKSLAQAYGAQIRALKGTIKTNAPAPKGKPPAPPKPATVPAQQEFAPDDGKEVPF